MMHSSTLPAGGSGPAATPLVSSEIYRSSEDANGSRKGLHFLVSLAIHAALIAACTLPFVMMKPDDVEKPELKMDMVLVRMPAPEPEPVGGSAGGAPAVEEPIAAPVARMRTLARRVIRSSVEQQRDVAPRRAVTAVSPTEVLADVQRVEVAQVTPRATAPRDIQRRELSTPTTVAPLQVAENTPSADVVESATPQLREAPSVTQSSGPRKLTASSASAPNAKGIEYSEPQLAAEGVVGERSQGGTATGARVRSFDPGTGSLFGRGGIGGQGGNGTGSDLGDGNGSGGEGGNGPGSGPGGGGGRDCNSDPVCSNYLQMIRNRVYARWSPSRDTAGGKVELQFRLDKSGSAHAIKLMRSESQDLGDSCIDAFRHASPFPPPPPAIAYMLNKNLIATFDYSDVR